MGSTTAGSQILFDTAAIGLCYQLARQLFPRQPAGLALLAAALYATYPFAIVWVTITGTETLATFMTLLWAVLLTRAPNRAPAALGLVIAAAFLVREFLGILLPISLLYLLLPAAGALPAPLRIRRAGWLLLGFGLLYGWWPARNLALQQRLVLVKPVSAGYSDMRPDMLAFLDWVHLWSNDNTYWLGEFMDGRSALQFPAHVVATPADQQLLGQLMRQARACGSSFYFRRYLRDDLARRNCNEQLRQGFEQLQQRYRQRHPWRAALEVPLLNVGKALFKTRLVAGSPATRLLVAGLFAWRSILLLLGFWGSYRLRHHHRLWPLLGFSLFMYAFICLFFHSLEMRYLLQADVLLLLPAAGILWAGWELGRQAAQRPAAGSQPLADEQL